MSDKVAEEERKIPSEENALGLRMVAWQLLIFDAIPVLFVWDGWRVGSNLWMWWVIVQGTLGLILLAAGRVWEDRMAAGGGAGASRHAAAIDTYRKAA